MLRGAQGTLREALGTLRGALGTLRKHWEHYTTAKSCREKTLGTLRENTGNAKGITGNAKGNTGNANNAMPLPNHAGKKHWER